MKGLVKEIDIFSVAADFELIKNSLDEAEQIAKDYIDCEKYNTLYTVSLKVPENPSK